MFPNPILFVSFPLLANMTAWPLMLLLAILSVAAVFFYIRRQNANIYAENIDYEELASILKPDKLYHFFNPTIQLPEDEYVADNIVDEYSDEFKNAFDPDEDKYEFEIIKEKEDDLK